MIYLMGVTKTVGFMVFTFSSGRKLLLLYFGELHNL